MRNEYLMILAMASGGSLFALGGMKGLRWTRRYVLPLILAGIALSCHDWVRCVLYGGSLCVALHLPYGQSTPYWGKFLTGCGFFLPVLFLGFTPWALVGPGLWLVLFFLSNTKPFDKWFPWAICCFLTGTLIGVASITGGLK